MRQLASPKELAEYTGVPIKTVYEWNLKGHGPKVLKVGRHIRYRWADIEDWLDRNAKPKGTAKAAPTRQG